MALMKEWIPIRGLTLLPFQSMFSFVRFGCLNILGPTSSDDIHSMMTSSNENIFPLTGPLCGEFTGHRRSPLTKAGDTQLWCFLWFETPSIPLWPYCNARFQRDENFILLYFIFWSQILHIMPWQHRSRGMSYVICKNVAIGWSEFELARPNISRHRLNFSQSKTNCSKNLNSGGIHFRELGPWPECSFRSLLQFLVYSSNTMKIKIHVIMS